MPDPSLLVLIGHKTVASRADPNPLPPAVCWTDDQRRPSSDRTGYIISVFRVMEGDDRHSFERDWPSWTGEMGHTEGRGGGRGLMD